MHTCTICIGSYCCGHLSTRVRDIRIITCRAGYIFVTVPTIVNVVTSAAKCWASCNYKRRRILCREQKQTTHRVVQTRQTSKSSFQEIKLMELIISFFPEALTSTVSIVVNRVIRVTFSTNTIGKITCLAIV